MSFFRVNVQNIKTDKENFDASHPLFGKQVVFTGELTLIDRKSAAQAVKDAGGVLKNGMSRTINYLVVGNQDPKVVGEKGISSKELKATELIEKGFDIKLISETQFTELLQHNSQDNKIIPQIVTDDSDGISLIHLVSEDARKLIHDFLYQHLYQNRKNYGFLINDALNELIDRNIFITVADPIAMLDPYGRNQINDLVGPYNLPGFKKNWKREVLIEWIDSHASNLIPEITKSSIAVTLHPSLTNDMRKIYSHLKQELRENNDWWLE